MTAEKKILDDWHRSLVILHRAHWEAASYFEDRNFWLGLAAAVVSAVAGTTVFATLEGSPSVLVRGLVGAFSIVAAMLSAIQAFLRSSEVAARHKAAGVKFGQLRREIEQTQLVGLPTGVTEKEAALKDFRDRWDEAESSVAPVPGAIFKRVSRNVAKYEGERQDSPPPGEAASGPATAKRS